MESGYAVNTKSCMRSTLSLMEKLNTSLCNLYHPETSKKIPKIFSPSTTSSHEASTSKFDTESENNDASVYFESLTSE